jgi:flagellar motor switch protein FliM
MSEVLEQEEIDALLNGVKSGEVDTAPKPSMESSANSAYDFTRQARIIRGRMPALEMVNERLVRALRLSMFQMLRRAVDVSHTEATSQPYSEYKATLSVPTSLNVIRCPPLSGSGLLVFEARLVFAVIDAYFGGSGRHSKIDGRDFTPTELQIIQILMDQVTAAMRDAWGPIAGIKPEFLARETDPVLANAMNGNEIVVVSRIRVDLDGKGGEIHITLPYSMLEPIRETLQTGIQAERPEPSERWSQLFRNQLEEADVEFVTRLGSATCTVGALIDMRPGDVIPLDFDGRAVVASDGIPLFWGELGQQAGRHVVRINQMNVRKSRNHLDAFVRKSN